jgi:hypothetical protein
VSDILDRIDAAVGCQQCGAPLDGSPSDDFCSDDCQTAWHSARAVELVGYREPWHHPRDFPGIRTNAYRSPVFELPPETDSLAVDWWCAQQAEVAARTDDQCVAVQLRMESLRARREELNRLAAERIREAVDGFVNRTREIMQGLTPAFQSMGEAFAQLNKNLARYNKTATVSAPDDPMTRALAARRNANTGPAQRRRPPRRIDARGAR